MSKSPLTIEQVLDLLTKAPRRIAALTNGLTSAQLQTPPNQGEWSIKDVLAHLRSCADMWGSAVQTILTQDRPTIRAINPRTWIEQTNYPELEFRKSFRAFTRQWINLLAVLEAIPEISWSRSATVTGAGKPLERTVFFYAHWLASHGRTHVKQIGRIANAMRYE